MLRFFWFISEIEAQVKQMKAEDAIMGSLGFFKLPKKKKDELLKPVYDSWRHDLFSPESFERFFKESMKKIKQDK